MSEWRDDLKRLMLKAGLQGKNMVFLFNDSQIKDEAFVEDINMLLNTGDVPNIFPADERADIIDKVQGIARVEGKKIDATPLSMYNFFIERVKANLHIVLGGYLQHFIHLVLLPGYPPYLISLLVIVISIPHPTLELT